MKIRISILFLLLAGGNLLAQPKFNFDSFRNFKTALDSVTSIQNDSLRNKEVNKFWSYLESEKRIPFVMNDSAAFLYRGNAQKVAWAGDFNSWNPAVNGYSGVKAGASGIWYCIKSFPEKARLDYKIVAGDQWILDPENQNVQWSGFGPNSELRMPGWVYPEQTIRKTSVPRGEISGNLSVDSYNLKYQVFYRVYTPYGYENMSGLPVIYVTDGQEYSDDKLGSMIIVLDNLIYQKKIKPVIAVFIDPRSIPNSSGINRRAEQYTINNSFADFVADELVPAIDSIYRTDKSPDSRAILGTSLGGINSAYFGYYRSETFHLIGINSPAFWNRPQIYGLYENSEKLPLKIFMSTGTINDTQNEALKLKSVLENKGYELKYIEVPEGHSWGNWRALLDDILIYFFGTD